ncbi:MAG: hypothetical protein U9Q69_01860 [Nanoarchaeota archaeon]|nr:hypothetical protein [Nanoarchaeota archaeon]
MKQKLNYQKDKDEFVENLEYLLDGSPLCFLTKEKIIEHEHDISGQGYEPGVIDVFGEKVGVIMKRELKGSLLDPSEDDLDILANARNSFSDYVRNAYSDKKKIPCESSFGRFIEDSYINSLIMNIFRFPTNELNYERLVELGLNRPEVLNIANSALSAYSKEDISLDLTGGFGNVDSVGGGSSSTYSGHSSSVDLSSDVCHVESHYKLNLKIKKLQQEIQKDVPLLSEKYFKLESKAKHLMMDYNPSLSQLKATNLFRMMLNLGGLYGRGKPLPLK